MKAAFYDKQGPAREVLQIGDLPDPQPQPGHVRVRVEVSGLNPTDLKTRSGFAGAPMPFPRITPHQDGAGTIDMVGEGVPTSRVGERVWIYEAQTGRPAGTAAEFVTVPAANAVPLPDNVEMEVGACLGIPALTAYRCLFADGDIRGKQILIHGGAGAVGLAAVLIAKWAGAYVITTVSRASQAEVVRCAGADVIIDRKLEDVAERVKEATAGAGVQRIIDVDLMANFDTDMACLAPSGIVVAYATENPAAALSIPFLKTMFKGFVFRFVFVYSMPEEARREAIAGINACLKAGNYKPVIAMRYPLAQVADAHQALEQGGVIGKILVMPTLSERR